jgi:hypothetical protein
VVLYEVLWHIPFGHQFAQAAEKVFAGDRPAVGDEEFLPFAQGGLGQGGL